MLEVVGLPDPEPGDGEVRIRVAAATVNPADTLFRSGGLAAFVTGQPPYVAGRELAGVVDGVDAETRWQPGNRVAAMNPTGRGAHAELVVVHDESAAAIPDGLGLVEAATLPMNGLTVRLALDTLALTPGDWLAVSGAAGAVGGYVTQMAVADGLRVVAVASAADEELVRGFGAEAFVPRGPDAAAEIRDLVAAGVDGLVDAANVGGPLLPAVRDAGRVVVLRAFDDASSPAPAPSAPRVAATYGPSQAAEAHRRLEAGGALEFDGP